MNNRPEPIKRITLGEFFTEYQGNRPQDKEGSTTYTENIHIKHLLRVLDARTALVEIPAMVQQYVNVRAAEKSRSGDAISHVTIKKELRTLTAIWNKWGMSQKLVSDPLVLRNISYPKRKETPPFQTWDQIMRKTKGNLESELWDSVFLSVAETEELLAHVRAGASVIRGHERHFPFVFPMFAFCAYTGCRRSEMIRACIEDIDFERGEITIREKKKDRTKKETYRHVPMAPPLRLILEQWLAIHPGGDVLFCRTAGEPLTVQMATHHFRWAVEKSKWQVLAGFHCLRHSLISNLAAHGISDHVIMGLVGHLNAETTRRYLHLRPQTLEAALGLLFGATSARTVTGLPVTHSTPEADRDSEAVAAAHTR